MSSTFGEKKRTSGPFGREGIAGGPLSYSFRKAHEHWLVGFVLVSLGRRCLSAAGRHFLTHDKIVTHFSRTSRSVTQCTEHSWFEAQRAVI